MKRALDFYLDDLDDLEYDDEEAYYQKVSEDALGNDNPNAFFVLGRMYLEGYYVNQDFEKAFKYFRFAHQYSNGEMDLGTFCQCIHNQRDNIVWTEAGRESYIKFLEYLSENDGPSSLIILADEYGFGEAVDKDIAMKIDLLETARRKGVTFADACLGEMYFLGEEVEKDYQKAYEYLLEANEKETTIKDYYLGEMYRLGIIFDQDENEAIKHYEKVIETGIPMDDHYQKASARLKELEDE